jgi:hypothetical protein
VSTQDRLIASCKSWNEFWEQARDLSTSDKGAAFERLTQLYLQTEPEYKSKLKQAWLSGSDRKERAGCLSQDLLRRAPSKCVEKPLVARGWHGNHLHLLLWPRRLSAYLI